MAGVLAAPSMAPVQRASVAAIPVQHIRLQHPMLRQWGPPQAYQPKPVQPKTATWIYAAPRLQDPVIQPPRAPGMPHPASMTKALDCSQKVVSVKMGVPQRKPRMLVDGEVERAEGVEAMNPSDFKRYWEQQRNFQKMVVIDLRADDRASGIIEGSVSIPASEMLSNVSHFIKQFEKMELVAFFCQYSAHRAPSVANFYRSMCHPSQRVMVMAGGFRGWEAERLPVQKGPAAVQSACDQTALQIGKAFAKYAAAQ